MLTLFKYITIVIEGVLCALLKQQHKIYINRKKKKKKEKTLNFIIKCREISPWRETMQSTE